VIRALPPEWLKAGATNSPKLNQTDRPSSPLLNSKHHHHQRDDDHSSLDNGQERVECDEIQQFITDRFARHTDECGGAEEG
jgi:hypothetical protein